MARINLLPWREAERKRRQTEFAVAAGLALALTGGLGLLTHLYFDGRIEHQQQRNQRIEREIAQLDRQIKEIENLEKTKTELLSRMESIQELQLSRPEIVRLFDQLVSAMPEGVYLTKIDQTGRAVIVEGRAQSNSRVSALMRNIESSQWIGRPRLLLIENKDRTGTGYSHFRLTFDQTKPAARGAEGDAA